GIINNTINGIPEIGYDEGIGGNPLRDNSGIFSGSGGSTNQKDAKFTYRDQWSKNIQVNANYSYNSTNIESVNESRSQDFSTQGTTFSVNNDNGDNNIKTHNLSLEIDNDLDSSNFLKVTPTLSYASALSNNWSSTFLSGLTQQNQIGEHF